MMSSTPFRTSVGCWIARSGAKGRHWSPAPYRRMGLGFWPAPPQRNSAGPGRRAGGDDPQMRGLPFARLPIGQRTSTRSPPRQVRDAAQLPDPRIHPWIAVSRAGAEEDEFAHQIRMAQRAFLSLHSPIENPNTSTFDRPSARMTAAISSAMSSTGCAASPTRRRFRDRGEDDLAPCGKPSCSADPNDPCRREMLDENERTLWGLPQRR